MQPYQILISGAVLAGLSVVTGAFGAHWLNGELSRRGLPPEEHRRQIEVWEVAARYQMYHALALIAVGLVGHATGMNSALRMASILFIVGVAIFSGCLYALVLSGVKVLGAIVPIGGTALIVGWVAFAIAAMKLR